MKRETQFRGHCDTFLEKLSNTMHESIQQVAIHGSADKIICSQGFGVWAEIKDEDGTSDPLQKYKASKWRNKGKGIALVWRPQTDQLVKKFLSMLDKGYFEKSLLEQIHKEEKKYDPDSI